MQEDIVKITSAVYKLLEVFPDTDPLKVKTKEKALAILEHATLLFENHGWLSMKAYLSPDRQKSIVALHEDIATLCQYVRLAQQQGWVSGANAIIVIKHYQDMLVHLPKVEHKSNAVTVVQTETIVTPKKISVEQVYTDRQKKILQIIAKKGQVQVADLLKEIPSITKRTLRRDMDDLLKKESVVREGQFNQVFYKKPIKGVRTSKMS